MMKPAPLRKLIDEVEFVPQAVIAETVFELAKRLGSDVEKGNDDLDEFYGAAVWLDELPVVVMHYRGHPADTSTIYLPFEIKDVNEISSIISRVVAELNVREKSIVWQRKDNPEL